MTDTYATRDMQPQGAKRVASMWVQTEPADEPHDWIPVQKDDAAYQTREMRADKPGGCGCDCK